MRTCDQKRDEFEKMCAANVKLDSTCKTNNCSGHRGEPVSSKKHHAGYKRKLEATNNRKGHTHMRSGATKAQFRTALSAHNV